MSEAYKKLIKTLRTLFEMDKADLDFGIYRILNQKRDEIDRFLEHDLLPQVKEAFADYAGGTKTEILAELDTLIKTLADAGMDPEQSPKVADLRAKAAGSVDMTAVENEIYSHLHTFFSRYYDKGDFISQRRYKADTYAIPYEGEEVKLYWANHDQYYVKSSEHLRDYAFTVQGEDGKTVRIKLVEADMEKDNVKASVDQERRFVLDTDQPLVLDIDELQIRFHYVPAGKKKQDKLNAEAVTAIFAQQGYDDWLDLLRKPAPTEANPKRTLLEKHLNDYTARNTFDYFIHKDLGGFLRRELDFYIKNEVFYLDDIDEASLNITQTHLRKIKILRSIAKKIIRMLAQVEDFQKKLWLKKKFVVEVGYCITLDQVPESLYPKIAENEMQIENWINLGLAEPKDFCAPGGLEQVKSSKVDFLKENQKLALDTRFFDASFQEELLASIVSVDNQCDGLLINSDNMQALNLIGTKYQNNIDCVYIDPPYNSKSTEILYKNEYKHSSWMSLVANRIGASKCLLSEDYVYSIAIDENEQERLGLILSDMFPGAHQSLITVIHNHKGIQSSNFSNISEYCYFMLPTNSRQCIARKKRESYSTANLNLRDKGNESLRSDARTCFYPFIVDNGEIVDVGDVPEDSFHPASRNVKVGKSQLEVWPVDNNGIERKWRYSRNRFTDIKHMLRAEEGRNGLEINIYKEEENYKTVWDDKKFNAGLHGTRILNSMLKNNPFDFPKSVHLVTACCKAGLNGNSKGIVLDFFAGSGTTGHAVINLNREDGGSRKFILIEMADYFDSVLKPRILKAAYSDEWREGKVVNHNGLSIFLKYLRLESYEDTLNNLLISSRRKEQGDLLDNNPSLREDYMLGYWLDVETADSPSLLNIEQFEDPFNYKLNIATGSVSAYKPTVVDLVETFNYLLGLRINTLDRIRGFKVVIGTNPQEEKVLVIWRKLKEQNNAALEAFMQKQSYHPRDTEFDHIYVNGDHTLEDPHSKVKMIEIEFRRLMFDVQDV
ncbi:hypothetical protein CKO42_08485 [Lamprobacter modestohalophilus]|uniref:DNA methylase N-4/N-6 domain-containing protein n=1 Tax=Lamprobacter modestohalophilus TaxID=1064514 RepID=A0A9X0W7M0_9GAMM|nr:DNA methyltransferase [Lamprobacter modestohalophilus]MBK1618473.1 hypothetical protein [Lamprobacter modestohalophilus]